MRNRGLLGCVFFSCALPNGSLKWFCGHPAFKKHLELERALAGLSRGWLCCSLWPPQKSGVWSGGFPDCGRESEAKVPRCWSENQWFFQCSKKARHAHGRQEAWPTSRPTFMYQTTKIQARKRAWCFGDVFGAIRIVFGERAACWRAQFQALASFCFHRMDQAQVESDS